MFKIDLHVHTSEVSSCGEMTASETVRRYKDAGFDGLCIMDHYSERDYHRHVGSELGLVDKYYSGYYHALEEGEKCGITVIPGMELRFKATEPNDYLIIGMNPDFLREHLYLYKLTLKEASLLLHEAGMLIIQAHPFRPNITIGDYTPLDGIEVYNGHVCHNSQNDVAESYCKERKLIMTSSSDCHEAADVGRGGIIFPDTIQSAQDIIGGLKKGNYQLIKTLDGFTYKEEE